MFSGSPPNTPMLSLAHSTLDLLDREAIVFGGYLHHSCIMEARIFACTPSAWEAKHIETVANPC
jgi:hypothetical protein